MSKKVLNYAGKRPMLLALIVMATVTLGLLFSGWLTPTPGRAQPSQPDPQPNVEAQCGTNSDGTCTECGPHTNAWTLDYCPSQTNTSSVSPSSYPCAEVGHIPMPTVVAPIYQDGQKHTVTTYDCTNAVTTYGGISYTVGSVQWDPSPIYLNTGGSWTCTAYVNVTSSDPALCPSPGRVNIGTCTWDVASPIVTTESVACPGWTPIEDKLSAIAKLSPMISTLSFDVSGSVSRETGQKCCNAVDGPSNYQKYTGSVDAKLNVGLVVPGTYWHGYVHGTSPILYQAGWFASLGPTVTLTPSGTLSVSGTYYDDIYCNSCIQTTFGGNLGIALSVGATGKAWVKLFDSGHWYSVNGYVDLSVSCSASTSCSASGTYYGSTCPNPGVHGWSFTLGQCVGTVNGTFAIDGWSLSGSKSITFWTSYSDSE